MKKIIFVGELILGNFVFRGYILQDKNDLLSYAIFVNDFDKPFIEMKADEQFNVKLLFNIEISNFINQNKTKDKKTRREIYKAFYNFVIESEKKASYMVFKKQKLNYIKNSKDLLQLKNVYINE